MHFDLATSLPVLERTPGILHAMLDGLPSAWTDATEGGESWSPYVIVGHLIPAGTGQDWARGLGMPLKAKEALTWLSQAQPRAVDVGHLLQLCGFIKCGFIPATPPAAGGPCSGCHAVFRQTP